MNTLKQKIFNYFGNNKILSNIMLICFIITSISWLWNVFIEIRSLYYWFDWIQLFRYIITLLFVINLFGVCLNFSKNIKLYTLLSYGVTYAIYETIMLIYSISITEEKNEIPILLIITHFAVIVLNIIVVFLLNYRYKNILIIALFITANYYFNTIHTEDFVYYLEKNLMYICIAAIVIMLFIPIYKNQCPKCGFVNTTEAKFCGKCGCSIKENILKH